MAEKKMVYINDDSCVMCGRPVAEGRHVCSICMYNINEMENSVSKRSDNVCPKRILFIVEAMGGGVFTYIVDLANELVNTYDMYIAYAVRSQTPENYKEYFDKRIHLMLVKNLKRSINPLRDIKAFFEIREIAKQVKPDVIHLHSSKAGVLGRFAFSGKIMPLFYTPHGYSFLMQNYSVVRRFVYRLIENVCGKRTCTTISCSEGEHQESLKLARYTACVNNGVNVKKLQEMIDNVKQGKMHPFTVFTLGRICHQKNPALFNKIALAMPDIRFVWIGDGELRDNLTAPNIEITGWVERADALEYSMNGNVFLLTSLWEGLPMSLLEAMYMKKLCVVSDVIGNRDVIHTGDNGFVCRETDEFVDAIRNAQSNKTDELVENAYKDVIYNYNTNKMAEMYSRIYREAFNSKV